MVHQQPASPPLLSSTAFPVVVSPLQLVLLVLSLLFFVQLSHIDEIFQAAAKSKVNDKSLHENVGLKLVIELV